MMNNELVELLKDINAGVDLPERLKQYGIETDSLPPRKRRRLLNRINWAADAVASTLARVSAAINSVSVADDEEFWTMADEAH